MEPIRFEERVVIVTGAGRGIGKAHARLLAGRGASVVVNDFGSAASGDGSDPGPAGQAVAEIRATGGDAVADTSDVAEHWTEIMDESRHYLPVDTTSWLEGNAARIAASRGSGREH